MSALFDERERAAEGLFARDEQLRFLAVRQGLDALGSWAAESLELTSDAAPAYRQRLVDAFVSGTPEADLVVAVQTDLENAGRPALSTTAGTVFAQAVAEATESLRHGPRTVEAAPAAGVDVREAWEKHHQQQGHKLGWSL